MSMMAAVADLLAHNADIDVTGIAYVKLLIMAFVTCFLVGAQLGIEIKF